MLIVNTIWASLVAQTVKNPLEMQETWVQSLGQENPLEKGMAVHSSILAWRIPWTEEPSKLQIHGVTKSQTRLSDSHTHSLDGTMVKSLPANAGDGRDAGLIPGSGRSPGEGNGSPLQYSCLENSMDREAWWATVYGVVRVGHD